MGCEARNRMMFDYPRMLYRPGTECRVWDAHDVDTLIVANETEELEALEGGWSRKPDESPKKPVKA